MRAIFYTICLAVMALTGCSSFFSPEDAPAPPLILPEPESVTKLIATSNNIDYEFSNEETIGAVLNILEETNYDWVYPWHTFPQLDYTLQILVDNELQTVVWWSSWAIGGRNHNGDHISQNRIKNVDENIDTQLRGLLKIPDHNDTIETHNLGLQIDAATQRD